MKVSVDRDKCVGAGQCVNAAPETFGQEEENGIVVLLEDAPPFGRREAVQQAARLCPARAITLTGA
jgi:ferredoxin